MFDIIFISLPKSYLKNPEAQVPMGILYLAATTRLEGYETAVKNYAGLSFEDAIQDLPQAYVYGITITSLEFPDAQKFAKMIKQKYPQSRIVLGGPGVVGVYKDVDFKVIDSLFSGEGESLINNVIYLAKHGTGATIYNGEPVENLDCIPFPARDLLPQNSQGGNVFAYGKQYKGEQSTNLVTSRGCPFSCSFCSAPLKNKQKMRYRSIENIVAEIKEVIEKYNIYQFRISDDMFTLSRQHVKDFCGGVKDLGIIWRISCRSKPNDMELLQWLYDAGCREVSVGVESFDDEVLTLLNKKLTAQDSITMLENCAKVGLTTRVLFMIRTPGQTRKTIERNIEALEKVPYDILCCTSYVPLPGSDVWMDPEKYNIEILDRNLSHYNFYFYGPEGQNDLKNIIKIKNRSLEEFNEETQYFRDYLQGTGKLNVG